jgi:hypothetical protein
MNWCAWNDPFPVSSASCLLTGRHVNFNWIHDGNWSVLASVSTFITSPVPLFTNVMNKCINIEPKTLYNILKYGWILRVNVCKSVYLATAIVLLY